VVLSERPSLNEIIVNNSKSLILYKLGEYGDTWVYAEMLLCFSHPLPEEVDYVKLKKRVIPFECLHPLTDFLHHINLNLGTDDLCV
jgi:hypothetical protein